MVSLNARFTIFSSLCALAVTSVHAVAIPSPDSIAARHSSPDAKGPTRVQTPVLNLPGQKKKSKGSKEKTSKHHKETRTYGDYMNPVQKIGNLIADGLNVHGNPLLDRFVSDGQQRHFQVPRHHEDEDSRVRERAELATRDQRTYVDAQVIASINADAIGEHAVAGYQRRSVGGVPGTVDIMSPSDGKPDGKRIASLFLEIDDSTGSPVYSFSASDTNSTELTLVPDSNNSSGGNLTIVSLHIPMFDASSTSEVHYCITYDRNPSQPEPLGLAECKNGTLPNSQKSQSFAYNTTSGVIQPMWFSGKEDTQQNPTSDASSANAAAASVTDTFSVSSRDTPNPDMTLVFRSTEPMAPAPVHAESVEPEPTVVTMTKTETSTVTVTSTMESASAAGPTMGALSVSDAASSGTSTASSSSATVTATASAPPLGALAVEVVHSTSISTTSSSAPASTATTSEPSVNAEAIASNIAASAPASSVSSSGSSASSTGSVSGSSAAPSMTPAATAPYSWKFKRSSDM